MKIGDKVTSSISLWPNDVGTISGIIPIWSLDKENDKIGELFHVIFPENDKHEGYQQTFNNKNKLRIVK